MPGNTQRCLVTDELIIVLPMLPAPCTVRPGGAVSAKASNVVVYGNTSMVGNAAGDGGTVLIRKLTMLALQRQRDKAVHMTYTSSFPDRYS